MINIAEAIKSGYELSNFLDGYQSALVENFANDKSVIINRIVDKFNVSNYETQKCLSNWKSIDRPQAKKIYDLINENIESFVRNFKSYWVGDTSLESIVFGEQEELLAGIRNKKTGKPYTLPYLRKVFDKSGYNVRGDYAYYDMGGSGLHVDLLGSVADLDSFLLTI